MQRFDLASLVIGFVAALIAGLALAPAWSLSAAGGVAIGCAVVMRFIGALPAVLAAAGVDALLQRLGSPEGGRATAVSTVRWLVLSVTSLALGVVVVRWLTG